MRTEDRVEVGGPVEVADGLVPILAFNADLVPRPSFLPGSLPATEFPASVRTANPAGTAD
jgi:hypothetical protein